MIDLDKENLTNIIQVFGKDGKIFQSEAQFQFELAWSLQTHLGCQVKLEDMRTVVRSKDNNPEALKKKFYTDIVVEQDGYSVALELKYKTADYSDKNLYLFNHGAVDLGRYDYLWDVHRIELLLGKGYKKELLFGKGNKEEIESWKEEWGDVEVLEGKECNKGFAVLLTNEKKYWEQYYEDEKEGVKYTIDNQFKIGEKVKGKTFKLFNNDLDWKKLIKDDKNYNKNYNHYPSTVIKQNGTSTDRAQPIHLSKKYDYQWEEYCELPNVNGKFRFVIIEVK